MFTMAAKFVGDGRIPVSSMITLEGTLETER